MMERMRPCRTCLAKKAQKNVSDLKHKGSNSTWSEIMLFCLDIKITDNTEVSSTKLCLKCYKKILLFYTFKLQAQKNDTILKNTKVEPEVKHEGTLSHEVKDEEESIYYIKCFANEDSENDEKKIEYLEYNYSSDDELSIKQNIQYEYVPEENLKVAKENEPIKGGEARETVSNGKVTKKPDECGLKEHMQHHKPADFRPRYPCDMCDKTFGTYRGRNRHIKTKHFGIKSHCKICNKAVVSLRSHTLTVHETSQLRHVCASCGRRYISQSALDAHTPIHSGKLQFPCEQCDKKFRTNFMMVQHIRLVHNKEKSYMCQYCSKSFFKKYNLQVHLRSHTKEKPYECTECGKFFTSCTVLKNHRLLHTDTNKYTCQLCDMTFARPKYLRNHMITHTLEKKHPCKYCGVKFVRPVRPPQAARVHCARETHDPLHLNSAGDYQLRGFIVRGIEK